MRRARIRLYAQRRRLAGRDREFNGEERSDPCP